jgi:hypothetical protein
VFSFDRTVTITNRGTFTSGRKAASYCGRGLAEFVSSGQIRMLESAELEVIRSGRHIELADRDPVDGKFHWYVGDSGGSRLMKQLTGISGGVRVYKAAHGV